MNIPLINAYTNNYTNSIKSSDNKTKVAKSIETDKSLEIKDKNVTRKNEQQLNSNNIITKQERNFFIKMFPESSAQLQQHVLFTRNGKTESPQLSKGSIVDGRI